MGRSFTQPGLVIEHIAGGTIAAGATVIMGVTVGKALTAGGTGDKISVAIEGVHRVTKVAGGGWTQGAMINVVSAGNFTHGAAGAGGVTGGCIAAATAASADTVGYVKLTPGTGVAGS